MHWKKKRKEKQNKRTHIGACELNLKYKDEVFYETLEREVKMGGMREDWAGKIDALEKSHLFESKRNLFESKRKLVVQNRTG